MLNPRFSCPYSQSSSVVQARLILLAVLRITVGVQEGSSLILIPSLRLQADAAVPRMSHTRLLRSRIVGI